MIQSMPVVSHPYVEAPPEDTLICRFMDLDKFREQPSRHCNRERVIELRQRGQALGGLLSK